jgi:hypothetical protein
VQPGLVGKGFLGKARSKPRAALPSRNRWSDCWLKYHDGAIRVGMALDAVEGPRFVVQDEAERLLV